MTFRMWRFRLAVTGRFGYHREVFKLWDAWARAEGGQARFNPFNTTEPWPGATDYNSAHVKNYPSAKAGIAATLATLNNGFYKGIVADCRNPRCFTALEIVQRNAREFDTWGTGAGNVEKLL